jgi:hypothetical protein
MIELNILPDGNLEIKLIDKEEFLNCFDITINNETNKIEFKKYPSVGEVLDYSHYLGNNWFDCTGLVGLTDSPIIAYDIDFDDNGKAIFTSEGTKLWWYPVYMIKSEWEVLLNEGSVIFVQALD